jgi:1,2-diacylglycerol 3-alpha-glucosyltransferase
MKILFVSDTYYPHLNGVYYFVCRLGPLLKDKGHEVAVIAPSETRHATLKQVDGIDLYGVPSLPVLYYPKVRFAIPIKLKTQIKEILRCFSPDIIHVQDHFSIAKAAIEISLDLGIPIVGTNHFMTENLTAFIHSEKWKRRISNLLWKKFSKVYNQLPIVTTPSEWAVSLIQPKLHTRVISISSGVDIEAFNPSGSGKRVQEKFMIPDKPILLFVGRLDPEKRIEETLEAVALALKVVDFCFVIVGKGVRKTSLEHLVIQLGIQKHVIFTGFVTDIELAYIYKLSSCFIISSTAELLSLGTLQAMSAGLPVIAVQAGALGELVQSGENGYLYKMGDIQELTSRICVVLGKPELGQQMKAKSLQLVLKHNIIDTVKSFERLYLKTVENTKAKKMHFNRSPLLEFYNTELQGMG